MSYVIITHHADDCPVTVDTYESDAEHMYQVFTDYFMMKINAEESLDETEIEELERDIHDIGVEVDGHFVYHTLEGTCVLYRQS